MSVGDGRVGCVDAVYVGLANALYPHAIFLDQTKRRFEGLFLSVHVLELVFCFCALDAFNFHHLVRLSRTITNEESAERSAAGEKK